MPRQDGDADPGLHPVLAVYMGLCGACGGSGVKPPVDTHAANRAAAKAEEG